MKRLRFIAAVATGLAATVAAAPVAVSAAGSTAAPAPAVVQTDKGAVRGVVGTDHRTFLGIPYAAPPEGDLRWRSPRPATGWRGVRNATAAGDSCAQGEHPIGVPSLSENCLYLNVTTPRTRPAAPRPVLVWIHGGSFAHGAADQYGATRLAARGDAVVVSMNYRLGAFGFLAHPALDDRRDRSGAFGLQDQQAALRWVQRNAAAFGGNPRNVTLICQSAGGYAVCDHLASPTAKGLFHRAIIHSAACTARWAPDSYAAPRPRPVGEEQGRAIAGKLGCTGTGVAGCLRGAGPAEILAATAGTDLGPVLGGPTLPVHPADALASGRVNRVPVLHGVNHDEEDGRIGAPEAATGDDLTQQAFEDEVELVYGDATDAVLARYPTSAYESPADALATLLTDDTWSRPAVDTNRLLAGRLPTYAFELAGAAPWYAGLGQPSFRTGTHHMSELAYLFDLNLVAPLDPTQQAFADQVIGHWTRFARTGDPNQDGSSAWRPYRSGEYVRSLSPTGSGRTDLAANHHYAFWSGLDRR